MAQTPAIRAPQAGLLNIITVAAQNLRVPQAGDVVVYNIPADNIRGTASLVTVPYTRISQSMQVTSGTVMAVTSGRIDNPRLNSWSYTLDGHDYYILRLGTQRKTLVFDLSTRQWSWWASKDSPRWRPSCGIAWRSSAGLSGIYGSQVVVGDDSSGILWVLDPEAATDDALFGNNDQTFDRVATGQMTATSRQAVPVYSVDLLASFGKPGVAANTVKLEYSDDQGNTYVTADQPMVSEEGSYDQEFIWRSLGQVRSPGRLFRITDDGAFARIDSLSVNE